MKYKIQLVNVFGEVVDESVRPLDAEEAIKFIRTYESLSKPAVEQPRALDAAACACPRVDGQVYHVVGCWVGFLESPRK